ncbi:Beta-galactosidase [Arcticibacter svalbardensis MN12-7]|uniref:Beta-galactosidase n=1 Tax=Arcticibacter svalbardensis MN12-7 TaxID=1150600 RepID=R9GQ31_9SPHI|nr:sugar-binding domain-containing protein [Arcticibacter svalbardensis]EOR93630.1 Beta-galactosidase [Arcticibacter svalbardensis MN12-7]
MIKDNNHPNYSLTNCQEEEGTEELYHNPLPRAVVRPNSFTLLDGEWKFAVDLENKGISENWFIAHNYSDTAEWPGSVETHMSLLKPQGKPWTDSISVWYEREFNLSSISEEKASSKTQLLLTFGACGYETRVWLNGVLLKTVEEEDVHFGEFTSFSYELDDEFLQENNRLTVHINDTKNADNTRGKQESSVYKRGGIWYQTYTGAVRSIWIERVERNRLRSRLGVDNVIEERIVPFNLTTRIHDAGTYTIRLHVYNKKQESKEPIATDKYVLHLEAGQKQQRVAIEIPEITLWSPERPHLYRLVAQLEDADGYTAEIESFFGLRKVKTHGCCIYLNNKPIYMDGILYQPGIAGYEAIKRHMYAMKSLGCNLVRIHIAGVDPRIYNLADKLGLLLWVEVPSPHRSTPQSRLNHKAELLRMLALIAIHPSVIIWSLYNEDWGVQDIATNPDPRDYIREMYNYMKITYPQFLVVDNDGWQHVSYEGKLKSDLLTVHLYTPDLNRWGEMLNDLIIGQQIGVAAFPLVVGDPFFFRKQIPLLVSEWGGFGFIGYGGPKDADERTKQIALFKKELRKRPIAGDVYTQATNIEEERNGLIDFDSGELRVPQGLLNSNYIEP